MARRLTTTKLATFQAIHKEIEERCYDVQQIFEEVMEHDEESAPYDLHRFYFEDYHVVVVLRNWEAKDTQIKIPNDVFVLDPKRFEKRAKQIIETQHVHGV
jgi:biotin-(acetyl-CoA carboxylase) ligase